MLEDLMISEPAGILILIGILLLLGLATEALARYTRLPRVTLLLLFGFLLGPGRLGLVPFESQKWLSVVAEMALVLLGFLMGEKLTIKAFRAHGRQIIWFSVAVTLGTALTLVAGLLVIGASIGTALLLAGISTATDPAATIDVIREQRARGGFSDTLQGIVAVDDAWGLIFFSIMLAFVSIFSGQGTISTLVLQAGWEVGGALLVGIVVGVPAAFLTGRIKAGEPTLIEALGVVLLCGGIAKWLNVSFFLASMALGAVVANLARHHNRPFHAIEGIEWPFMILFFLYAGASLKIEFLTKIGLIGIAYLLLRVAGRILGSWAGGIMSKAGRLYSRWMGLSLLPQAGVALGMALVASHRFPETGRTILPIVVGTTVIFELIGPVLTRIALIRVGEVGKRNSQKKVKSE
jgi:Kef-type K+ transport system membrane component KefB